MTRPGCFDLFALLVYLLCVLQSLLERGASAQEYSVLVLELCRIPLFMAIPDSGA
jgi:hypothetical protein